MYLWLKLEYVQNQQLRKFKGDLNLPILINIKLGFRNSIYLIDASLMAVCLSMSRLRDYLFRWHRLARKSLNRLKSLWELMIHPLGHRFKFKLIKICKETIIINIFQFWCLKKQIGKLLNKKLVLYNPDLLIIKMKSKINHFSWIKISI